MGNTSEIRTPLVLSDLLGDSFPPATWTTCLFLALARKRPSRHLSNYYRRSSYHRSGDIPGEPANEGDAVSANPISADGLGPAEREELKMLIEGYRGFGLLSVIRALMFSSFRGFMVSLMGIALLIGQWAGPIGFIAFKLESEDITECTK